MPAAGPPIEGAREALALGVVGRERGWVVAAAAEDAARAAALLELFLLTGTAIARFPRLGYDVVARSEAAAAVGESIEFTTICHDAGAPMRKLLGWRSDGRVAADVQAAR